MDVSDAGNKKFNGCLMWVSGVENIEINNAADLFVRLSNSNEFR